MLNNGIGTYKVIKAAIKKGLENHNLFICSGLWGSLDTLWSIKIFAETISKCYKNQIEIIIVRPFNIYGVGQNSAYGYVIHNFAERIRKKTN